MCGPALAVTTSRTVGCLESARRALHAHRAAACLDARRVCSTAWKVFDLIGGTGTAGVNGWQKLLLSNSQVPEHTPHTPGCPTEIIHHSPSIATGVLGRVSLGASRARESLANFSPSVRPRPPLAGPNFK